MITPVTLFGDLAVDVERRKPKPQRDPDPFWSFLSDAHTPHVAPTVTAVAPDTGAAIAVIGILVQGER